MTDFNQDEVKLLAVEFEYLGHGMQRTPEKGNAIHIAPSDRRFRTWFGASPVVVAKCWLLLLSNDPDVDRSTKSKQHLLWGLMLMKDYGKIESLAANASPNGVDEKTFSKHAWAYIVLISDTWMEVIKFENRLIGDIGNDCTISVDGVDFWQENRILPNGRYDKKMFSYKHRQAGLRYEIGLSILGNYIVWLNGPFLAGEKNDVSIFRSGLKQQLMEVNERCEADDGYIGECPIYTICPSHIAADYGRKRLKYRVGLRQESLNERFKNFDCMVSRFRHSGSKHSSCFYAIAVLTQLALESGEELFDAREYNDAYTDAYVRDNLNL